MRERKEHCLRVVIRRALFFLRKVVYRALAILTEKFFTLFLSSLFWWYCTKTCAVPNPIQCGK